MLLVRAAQREGVFAGGRKDKRVGEPDAGLQRVLLNEDHSAVGNRFIDRKNRKA